VEVSHGPSPSPLELDKPRPSTHKTLSAQSIPHPRIANFHIVRCRAGSIASREIVQPASRQQRNPHHLRKPLKQECLHSRFLNHFLLRLCASLRPSISAFQRFSFPPSPAPRPSSLDNNFQLSSFRFPHFFLPSSLVNDFQVSSFSNITMTARAGR